MVDNEDDMARALAFAQDLIAFVKAKMPELFKSRQEEC
jgi:hypothetical protein